MIKSVTAGRASKKMKTRKQNTAHGFCKDAKNESVPLFFRELTRLGDIASCHVQCTCDGFFVVTKSIADILIDRGIPSLQSAQGQSFECDKFFDDWYLYAVPAAKEYVYGLLKMREQEYDAENGVRADGDAPGVTISFIAFNTDTLMDCLFDPIPTNQKALEQELNRVVASRRQKHHPAIKAYFKRSEAQGPYLIAELYTGKIAAFAQTGSIPVPKRYAALCQELAAAKSPAEKGGSLNSSHPIMKRPDIRYVTVKEFSFKILPVSPSMNSMQFWQPIPPTFLLIPLPPKCASMPVS